MILFIEQGSNGKPKQILGIASNITERKKTELELQEINHQFSERLIELEKRTQKMIRLGEMTDFLQACLTVAEAETAIFYKKMYVNLIFPVATVGKN
ncbi:hypothetical protein [Chroococcus sp. FPU101]|uniref:hypothetical protein n=1 Tax=Chroococcus sp. FPU101 TaxID=1974212 RepID=UPI001AA52FCF|nr:hypothetical protein [Chroococcus sp. FPU101]GFE67495.1 hypothetical protein CFPU101_01050 [Chroococcus sp. FPU101]